MSTTTDQTLDLAEIQPAQSRADEALARLAQHQLHEPDPQAQSFEPPPGGIAQALSLLDPESDAYQTAHRTLDETIDHLLDRSGEPSPPDPDDAAASSGSVPDDESVRAYIAGRAALLEADLPRAIDQLTIASALAPFEPRVWRELGEAQRRAGDESSALASLNRAIELGINQPAPMLFAALESRRQGGTIESAAILLARASRLRPAKADPGLAHLIDLHLGSSLLELGSLAAGDEALAAGLTLPGSFTVRTQYADELGEVLRQQATLLIRMGDAMARLDRPGQALDRYRRALRSARPGTEPIPNRRVIILTRLGRSAQAARVLTRTLATPIAVRDDRLVRLTRALAQLDSVRPLLADRIDELWSEDDRSSPARSSWWARLRAAAAPSQHTAPVLVDAIRHDPTRHELIVDLLEQAPDESARADGALELVTGHPLAVSILADAVGATSRRPDALLEYLLTRFSVRSRLLAAEVLLLRGDPLGARRALSGGLVQLDPDAARFQPALTTTMVSIAAALGDWDHADDLLATLNERPPRDDLARAIALRSMQRFDDSIRTLESIPTPTPAQLHVLADTARLAGRPALARSAYQALHDLDPYDEAAYEGLLGLPPSPDEDQSPAQQLVDRLGTDMPGARLARRLEAQQLASVGELARAEQASAQLADELADPGLGIPPLLGTWEVMANRTGPASLQRGLAWVEDRLATHPASDGLIRAQAVLLLDLRRPDEALERLENQLPHNPSAGLHQLRERIIRTSLGDPQRADRLAMDRLTRRGRSIPETIEYAGLLAQSDRLDEAADELERALPRLAQLTAPQQQALVAIVSIAARKAAAEPTGPAREPTLALIIQALDRQVVLPEPILRLNLALLTVGESIDAAVIGRAVAHAVRAHPDQARDAALLPIRALASAGRVAEALDLMRRLAPDHSFDDAQSAMVWAALIAQTGTASDVPVLLAHLRDPATLRSLVNQGDPGEATPDTDAALDDPRALARLRGEVAYRLAGAIGSRLGQDESMAVLEIVLELDDRHALALNDLGYYLAQRGEHLDRAERLTMRAVELLPDQSNVLDSLAWVRYRAGHLDDTPASDQAPARAGAVSLLTRAVAMDSADLPSPTLLDHLGDALWASGRTDEARSAWRRAAVAAQGRVQALRGRGLPERVLAEAVEESDLIRAKLDALDAGRSPTITPILGPTEAFSHPTP